MKLMRQIVALLEDDKSIAGMDPAITTSDFTSAESLPTDSTVPVDSTAPTDSTVPQDVKKFWNENEGAAKTFSRTRIYPVRENDNGSFTLFIDADGRRNELTTFSNKSALLRKFKQLDASEHNPYSGENLQAYRKRSTVDAWLNTGDAVKLKIDGETQLLKTDMYLIKHTSGAFTLAQRKKFDKNHEAL